MLTLLLGVLIFRLKIHTANNILSGNQTLEPAFIINDRQTVDFFINHQQNEEYYKQQRLVTDTGIEIKVPVSEYDNKDKIEFITNPDGTISILIKNIKTIRK